MARTEITRLSYSLICRLAAERRGAASIEYALLVFLIGLMLLASLKSAGLSFSNIMEFITNTTVSVFESD